MSRLFKVVDKNGSEWTLDRVRDYLRDRDDVPNLFLINDVYMFFIDDEGNLGLMDKCDDIMFVDSDDFKVVWNKEWLEKLQTEVEYEG